MHWAGDTLRSFDGLMRECECSHAQSTYHKYSMSKNYILYIIYSINEDPIILKSSILLTRLPETNNQRQMHM